MIALWLLGTTVLGVLLGLWLLPRIEPDKEEFNEYLHDRYGGTAGCSCSVNEPTRLCAYCTRNGTELWRNGRDD